jgi:hypothetical protein
MGWHVVLDHSLMHACAGMLSGMTGKLDHSTLSREEKEIAMSLSAFASPSSSPGSLPSSPSSAATQHPGHKMMRDRREKVLHVPPSDSFEDQEVVQLSPNRKSRRVSSRKFASDSSASEDIFVSEREDRRRSRRSLQKGEIAFLIHVAPDEPTDKTGVRDLEESKIFSPSKATVDDLKSYIAQKLQLSSVMPLDVLFQNRSVVGTVTLKKVDARHRRDGGDESLPLELCYRSKRSERQLS